MPTCLNEDVLGRLIVAFSVVCYLNFLRSSMSDRILTSVIQMIRQAISMHNEKCNDGCRCLSENISKEQYLRIMTYEWNLQSFVLCTQPASSSSSSRRPSARGVRPGIPAKTSTLTVALSFLPVHSGTIGAKAI